MTAGAKENLPCTINARLLSTNMFDNVYDEYKIMEMAKREGDEWTQTWLEKERSFRERLLTC